MIDSTIAGAIIGLFGSCVGAFIAVGCVFLTQRHTEKLAKEAQRLVYIERQVNEFYAPVVALRKEIVALIEIGERIESANQANIREPKLEPGAFSFGARNFGTKQLQRQKGLYQQIHSIFREKSGLADKDIVDHYPALIKMFEYWDNITDVKIGPYVSHYIDADGERVSEIFKMIEEKLVQKQKALSSGILQDELTIASTHRESTSLNEIAPKPASSC